MEPYYSVLWVSFILLLAGGGLLLLVLSRFRRVRPAPRLPYVAIPILTESERRFFSVLAVAMKCVDFVIVNHTTLAPLLVVELDDKSHERVERQQRDKFVDDVLATAQIRIVHWPVLSSYNIGELTEVLCRKMKL